jgi:predicted Zn-dependent protease
MSVTAKEIREDIARARAACQKGDLLRCLGCLRDAVDGLVGNKVFGREKFEIEALFVEALRDLNGLRTMQRVMPRGVHYVRGKERELHAKLSHLHSKLKEAIDRARLEKLRKRMLDLDESLLAAQVHLKKKEEMEARKLFRRAADQFAEQPGLLSDIGTRMLMGGLVQEAVEYLRKGLEENSRDERAHSSLIMCYEVLGQMDKVEEAIKNAIRMLGPREDLYIRLGKVALSRRNWSTVLNVAEAVLKKNPLNVEARKLRNQVRPKIYGKGAAPGAAGANAAKPAPAKPKKSIKLDL